MLVIVAACWTLPARAVTVGIARQARPSAVTSQALLRVSAEIRSLGLDSRMVDLPDSAVFGASSAEGLPALAAENGVDAVIVIRGAPLPTAVEVWAADRKGRSVARSVSMDGAGDRAPETVAIRAIELLRSCLLEIDLLAAPAPGAKPAAAVPPPTVVPRVDTGARPPEAPFPRFGVGAGGLLVVDPDGVGPALLPCLRADWRFLAAWLARVELAGAGTAGAVDGSAGNARITQDQALLGVVYQPFPGHRWRPLVGLAAGVLRTAADGEALPQYDGRRVSRWSFLMDGVAGGSVALGPRWDLTAGVHIQAAAPYPAVRFVGQTVATAAHPNVLFGLAAELWL